MKSWLSKYMSMQFFFSIGLKIFIGIYRVYDSIKHLMNIIRAGVLL